jgi:type VI secretion system secreted protein VgrG
MVHIPRIGQEVLVDFVDGDVDQPVVVGSLYNADQMPPYALPANKTQSGIKSRSSLQGSPSNYNEIRFEDKKGSEQVLIHAEKNQDIEVENDETHWVGHDRSKKVDHDETIEIGNNRTATVGNDETETITNNRTVKIKRGNDSLTLEMGNSATTLKMGNSTTKLDLGKSETEAMQSIELKVGQSSIKLDQMGVTIKGMMINIEGQIQVQVKGLMTQVNGTAMLTCKGGLTMIN